MKPLSEGELPTRNEAEIAYWSFEYYIEGAGFIAKQILSAYANGKLAPTLSEEKIIEMLEEEDAEGYPLCSKDSSYIAKALAGKLVRAGEDK